MLTVMDKYGTLKKLEDLYLKNLSMGSLLILLPFCPNVTKLALKYSLRSGETNPNLTDALFLRIFQKNQFRCIQVRF